MATLAIKGHPERGNEILGILLGLGATAYDSLCLFNNKEWCWYIDERREIKCSLVSHMCRAKIYTLEQFLKKFPYKIGDRVIINGNVEVINRMRWDGNEVIYGFFTPRNLGELPASKIQPYKEQTYLNPKANKEKEEIEENLKEAKEIMEEIIKIDIPQGYEFAGIDKQQVVFEKISCQYPKTYRECARFINRFAGDKNGGYRCDLITNLQRLFICRDAYWKIAGDWKPDWTNSYEQKYVIVVRSNEIVCYDTHTDYQSLLAFPTEEMRDVFYENFKKLIEQCKEFL